MKNKKFIKQSLIVLALMTAAITLFSFVPTASAAFLDASDAPGGVSTDSLKTVVLRMVNYFLTFLGIVAVIMVIYGGVTYVTAAGNDDAIGKAKTIIMYALIGIIIILLSFAVVQAILGAGVEDAVPTAG